MERTGIMRGKENVEQQQLENGRMWDHASKLREARDARRKRILARSSERLAFITGEANAIPTSPLLDKSNQDICPYNSPDHESTMKKSLFNDYEEGKQRDAQKKIVNNRENTSQAGAAIAQPLKNTDTMQGSLKEEAHECMNENPITLKSKFSYCIKQTLFPRRISATCIALAFLVSAFTHAGQLEGADTSSSTLGYALGGHLGRQDALLMICFSLALVMLVDLVLLVGAFFFFPDIARQW